MVISNSNRFYQIPKVNEFYKIMCSCFNPDLRVTSIMYLIRSIFQNQISKENFILQKALKRGGDSGVVALGRTFLS